MKNQRDTSLRIRLAGLAILGLFIALAAAAYFSGREVKRSSELIVTDAVPGTIAAHDMRMAMSRSIGWAMVAASAQTTQSRDASLKIVHDADVAFTNAVEQYETTIKINPAEDRALLNQVTGQFAEFHRQRMAYEALILAGNREGSAAFLEGNLVPAYVSAIQSGEELLKHNNANSITYSGYIRNSVYRLYWAVAVVMVLALICAGVLFASFSIRRREMKKLRESEEKFSKVFQSSPIPIAITGLADGLLLDVNESFLRMSGFTREEVIGHTTLELNVYPDPDKRAIIVEHLHEHGHLHGQEQLFQTKSGQIRNHLLWFDMISISSKQWLLVIALDITERKRAEEVLREKQAQLLFAMDIAKLAHWEFDVAKNLVTGDENIFQMHGTTSAQEGGLSMTPEDYIRKFVHPLDAALVANEVALGVATTDPNFARQFEHRFIRKDGTEGVLMVRSRIVMDASGRTGKIHGTSQDITERKRTEDLNVRLAMAIEQAAETIVITDPDGTILYANPAFEKTTGYTRAEALGQNPRILKSNKHDAEFYRRMWKTLEHGEVWSGHFINRRKDGMLYEEEATISPVRDTTGEVTNYVAVKRDVTHEVQLEEQFRQSQKMEAVGQLASGVAHDFNNILAIIQMQSDLLKAEGNLSPEQTGFASEIGGAAQRAAALTRQLLLFSRKEKMQTRELELNQSVNDMTKMLRRTLGEDIQLQFKFAMEPLFVQADAGMMDQVLMNLAVNARDAMPKGGKLTIETSIVELDELSSSNFAQSRPGSFICLSVSDTGCGIPPEIMPKIFEPFFTTKDVGKGTGLGLATVFGIVQQHQGRINAYSEVGQGTTFRIYLPRLARISDQKFVSPTTEPMPGGKETILVIEDEPKLRASVINILSRLGYNVLEASDGATALKIWKQNPNKIHLLLTDMVMPGMTGKDLSEQLLKENPKLKVIYVSGYSAEVAGKDFPLQEGVNFLTKPFQAQKLAQTIRNILDKEAQPK